MVTVDLYIEHETKNALLVYEDGMSEKVWIPKSQVQYRPHDTIKGAFEFTMSEWLAKEKGLI